MEQQIKEFETLTELLEDLEREGITGNRRSEIVRRFLFLQARKKRIPFSGGFELTPLCNFDCKMCYVHLNKGQMGQNLLTTEQWIEIMRQAIDAGMMYADITGGECLTYPGFKEVYLYLLSRGVRVSVLTNGSLLTDEWIDFFVKYRPEVIQISLYGSNDEAYKKVTGQAIFSRVKNNISRVAEKGIKIKVVVMPHRYMKEDMNNLLKMVQSLGVEYAMGEVNLPARVGTGRELEDYVADSQLVADMKLLDWKYRQSQRSIMEYPIQEFYGAIPRGLVDDGGIPCGSGRCTFHVNWKGELTPCIPFYMISESLNASDFLGAWKRIGDRMGEYRKPIECLQCDIKDTCMACPAEKCLGILNGSFNKVICDRTRRFQNAMERYLETKEFE